MMTDAIIISEKTSIQDKLTLLNKKISIQFLRYRSQQLANVISHVDI